MFLNLGVQEQHTACGHLSFASAVWRGCVPQLRTYLHDKSHDAVRSRA